jgi:hypothetical protein
MSTISRALRLPFALATAALIALALPAIATAKPDKGPDRTEAASFAGMVQEMPTDVSGTSGVENGEFYDVDATIKHVTEMGGELYADQYDLVIRDAGGTVVENVSTDTSTLPPLPLSSDRGSRCQILFLDVQPIFLDLLGLELQTSQITVDLTAVSGPNKLLGNLLCAVTGLLDNTGNGGGLAQGLNQLISNVNAILSRLLG